MCDRLGRVFGRLSEAGLRVKAAKCQLFQREVAYLGHRVSAEGVGVDLAKVRAVAEWPRPRCAAEVRSFVGLCSYYRSFVEGFATLAAPLHAIANASAEFVWTIECQEAFDNLKQKLSSTPFWATRSRRAGSFSTRTRPTQG